ncbi:hypothetical protein HYW87_04775 [Candidatus Roizmanbacteria bacterium]|nr:hypothetical protein [Candidatus Roizmanbacteria bacterium]
MLLRKLLKNFLLRGKIETTITKAKALKSALDRLLAKTKDKTESNKRYILKKLGDPNLMELLFAQTGEALKSVQSGFIKMKKIGPRMSDGSIIARLEWAYPVVLEKAKSQKLLKKTQNDKTNAVNKTGKRTSN